MGDVTPPRCILPGQTLFVTCRAVSRQFRLLPTSEVRKLVLYALAVYLGDDRYAGRILLHEFCFLSNHYHLLLTDLGGVLPDFMRDVNSLISRSLNAHRGTTGTNFEKGYNAVLVTDPERALEHAVYTLANPCAANLVVRARQWGGATSVELAYGEPLLVERPAMGIWKYKGDDAPPRPKRRRRAPMDSTRAAHQTGRSTLPEHVELVLTRPNVRTDLSDTELRAHVLRRLHQRELDLKYDRRRRGHGVLGMKGVLRQKWHESPASREDLFGSEPVASGRSKWALAEAKQRRQEFLAAYAQALAAYRAGDHDVEFPPGTWLMVRRYRAKCAPPPAPPG